MVHQATTTKTIRKQVELPTHKSCHRQIESKMKFSIPAKKLVFSIALISIVITVDNVSHCQKIEAQAASDQANTRPTTTKHQQQKSRGNNQSQYHHHHKATIPNDHLASNADRDDCLPIITNSKSHDQQNCLNRITKGNKRQQQVSNDNNSSDEQKHFGKKRKLATTTPSFSSSILHTFSRVNHMRAYHLDLQSYRQDALYSGDPNFVNSNSLHDLQRCRRHLTHFHNLMKSFTESDPLNYDNSIDSIRLADTFGRPGSGLLLGNQFWLGSYESCLDLELPNPFFDIDMGVNSLPSKDESTTNSFRLYNESASLGSQYCLGLTQFPDWNSQDTKLTIRVGLCLPETCTSSMLNTNEDLRQMVESTMLMNNFEKPFDKLKLHSVYCLPHETSEARKMGTSAKMFVSLMGAILTITLLSTLYDYFDRRIPDKLKMMQQREQSRSWRRIIVESFSLIRNYEKFAHMPREIKSDETSDQILEDSGQVCRFNRSIFFNCIAGIKCIGLFWIIAAHTFLVCPIQTKNLISMDKVTQTYLGNLFVTAHLMVDSFFTISGILAAYLIFRGDISKLRTKHWIIFTIHRYWRLTPIYLLIYWYTKSVGQLMKTGPLWDYGTAAQSPRLHCSQESWLIALLHLSDFKSPKNHCVPFAWFTANSLKFWLVTPFFLIMIAKSMRQGYRITLGAIVANIMLVFVLAFTSSVDIKSVMEFKPESADNMLNTMGQVYTRPYSRIGAYLVGLLAGHIIYRIDAGQLEIKISKNTKILVWTLCSATIMVLTFLFKLTNYVKIEEAALPLVFSIASGLMRPMWALITCLFIYALSIGHARWISSFLTANFWRYCVKLSFCAYLIQGEVIASMSLSHIDSPVYTYGDLILDTIVNIVLTITVSFIVLLLIEYPLIGIEELILPVKRIDKRTTHNQDTSEGASMKGSTASTFTDTQKAKSLIKDDKLKCS